MQLAYLKAQGEKVEPIYRTEKEQFDSLGNDSLEKIIEYAGADELKKVFEGGDFDLMDKLADKAADALEEKYTHGSLEGQNRRWQMRINKLRNENRGRLYGLLEHAYKMMTDTSNGKVELDVEATREAIRQAAPEAAVKNWVKEQLGSVLRQKGIRNSKDRFTPGGKRRSFAELHNPYTLENLVAAMNAQNARGQDVWGVSAATLMSTTTAEYKSLDEVRADKNRLQQMPEEEYKALLEKADGQIEKVVDKLRSRFQTNARNARNVVGGVSGQSLHIDNLFRINAEFFFNVFRRKELVFHRIIEFDAGTNKLHQILVAGNNNNLKPLSQRHVGISGNQVVRLISLHFQVIKVQRFYRFADDGELRNQIFGNFFARAFVVGKNIVTEILPFGVKENQTIFTGDF